MSEIVTAVVIDDNLTERGQIAGILARLGVHVVAQCGRGDEGLAALRKHRPTIATVDKQVPMMDGIDIIRAAVAENLPTKLVMCSGSAQKAAKDLALASGATMFIAKPYDEVLLGRDLAKLIAPPKTNG